jgi:hypothetical protein
MKINEKFKSIEHVRILAKEEAQRSKEDQRIYQTTYKGMEIYLFARAAEKKRGIELIQYTPEPERGDILSDNGDGEFKPIKKAKEKAAKVEAPVAGGDLE